jgi:hypothetical protein
MPVSEPNASFIVVDIMASDDDRGLALAAAYQDAKTLSPGGFALSAANRAMVVLPLGNYRLTSTLVLDADFVDLVAQIPQSGGVPSDTDDWNLGVKSVPRSMYRPPGTTLYADLPGVTVVEQTARDVRLTGFGIAQIFDDVDYHLALAPSGSSCFAFLFSPTTEEANDRSIYTQMYFWHSTPFSLSDGIIENCWAPTGFTKHVAGTWVNCIDGACGMRVGKDGRFTAEMRDCFTGVYAIGGDAPGGVMGPCYLKNVKARGSFAGLVGIGSFGGCNATGVPSLPTAWFVDCEAGIGAFNIGSEIVAAGNYIRCRAGMSSFGSSGEFAGYAEDCVAGAGSFGAKALNAPSGKVSGTLIRCSIVPGIETAAHTDTGWLLKGATIRDSRLFVRAPGVHCLTLLDDHSVITGSDILVKQGGTGLPVYSATPRKVSVAHCRMNNAVRDANGMGNHVTNRVQTPNNVVDNQIA